MTGYLQQLTWSETRADMFHYRTKDQVEVNIVLEGPGRKVVGIEIKAGDTVRGDDFRGLRHLEERLGDDFLAGIVLYTGGATLPFGPRMRAMPIASIWEVGDRTGTARLLTSGDPPRKLARCEYS